MLFKLYVIHIDFKSKKVKSQYGNFYKTIEPPELVLQTNNIKVKNRMLRKFPALSWNVSKEVVDVYFPMYKLMELKEQIPTLFKLKKFKRLLKLYKDKYNKL